MSNGTVFMDLAVAFMKTFPHRSDLTPDDFDEWGINVKSRYAMPDLGCKTPAHKAWGTHVQNRHTCKRRVNLGAACELLPQEDRFEVIVKKQGLWVVEPIERASFTRLNDLPEKAEKSFHSRMKTFERVKDAVDLGKVMPLVQQQLIVAEAQMRFVRAMMDAGFYQMGLTTDDVIATFRVGIDTLEANGEDPAKIADLRNIIEGIG
jgi:hypothetical protein